ncbi:MAG: fibronectin type III domain-containing protein [Candidatus Hydrogenedentota bacterium]
MDQPIYWPDRHSSGNRYEYAWDSIQAKDGGRTNPLNDVRAIFSLDDRVAAYQWRPKDSIGTVLWHPDAGAQINYSACLIENVRSLGDAYQLGYSPTWYSGYREGRNWSTSGGKPRLDIVLFTFHHILPGLSDPIVVQREIEIYKQIYPDAWGTTPGLSKGYFPSEIAFSERLIPVLVQQGIEWVVVSNSHISRCIENFPLVLGTGGENTEPPNRADIINPAQNNWFRMQIDRGCSPCNAYPYSMRPHYAKYVDPNTGTEYKIIVVPTEQAMSWKDGYQTYGTQDIDGIAWANEPATPMLIVFSHDGDNAYGGGYSYYMESVPSFVSQANSKGYSPTTIQQYLTDHPVDPADIVHVEDGPWVNADGDMGSPTYCNWNWPLMSQTGTVDIANGWAEDERNWAVFTAALNRIVTAEQVFGAPPDPRKIIYPWEGANNLELAWHFYLGGTNSGFMYYGKALDMEVKPTISSNEAVYHADLILGSNPNDLTPPTIWLPQRYPYNPGSLNFGAIYNYKQYYAPRDFWVWTFIYDLSGIQSVTLKYRIDNDGVNPLSSNQNEVYQDGTEVGTWRSLPMTQRVFPKDNVYNDPEIDFFELPIYIADEYYVHVDRAELNSVLIDYYVEAIDSRGNITRSPIQHCYIGDGSGSGGTPQTLWTPTYPTENDLITITKNIATTDTVYLHWGVNSWTLPADYYWPSGSFQYDAQSIESPMTKTGSETYQITIGPFNQAQEVNQVNFVFHWGSTWDNNNGQNYNITVTQVPIDTQPPDTPTGLTITEKDQTIDLSWNANTEPDLAGYYIYRKAPADTTLVKLNSTPWTQTTYSDTGLTNNSVYYYRISAVDNYDTPNESGLCDTESGIPRSVDTAPPLPPTGLSTAKQTLAIKLSWSRNLETDLSGYKVYSSTISGGPYTQIADTSNTYITHTDLNPAVRYYYVVKAYDSSNNLSDTSSEVSDTPLPDPAPSAPTGLTPTPSSEKVTLTWNPNSEPDVAGYRVYYSTLSFPLILQYDTTQTTVVIYNLVNDSTYQFVVSCYDTYGSESTKSGTVTATPKDYITVHFSLDLTSITTENTVTIAGNRLTPAWSPTSNQLSVVETGSYYKIDFQFLSGDTLEYKYVINGNQWENDFSGGWSINRDITIVEHEPGIMWVHNKWNIDGDLSPGSPTGLTPTDLPNSIKLEWLENSEFDRRGYIVLVDTDGSFDSLSIVSDNYITISNMNPGDTALFKVVCVDSAFNVSGYSSTITGTAGGNAPPSSPTGLNVLGVTDTAVILDWADNTEADLSGYFIYKSTTSGSNYTRVNTDTHNQSYYTVSNLTTNETYYFVVLAVDSTGLWSDTSSEVQGTPRPPDTTPPSAPANLRGTVGDKYVILYWTKSPEQDVTGYNVYRKRLTEQNFVRINTSVVTDTTYTSSGLTNNETYQFYVTALDNAYPNNESDSSNTVSLMPYAPPTFRTITIDGDFLDWIHNDVIELDGYNDDYKLYDNYDQSRDIIAIYAAEGQDNYYFRIDFYELGIFAESTYMDAVFLLDFASGGQSSLPNVTVTTDKPWEIAIVFDDVNTYKVYTPDWVDHPTDFLGAQIRSNIDCLELGIKKSLMKTYGFTDFQTINIQCYTYKDAATQITDAVADDNPWADGILNSATLSTAQTGTAKYSAILHANQSLNQGSDIADWIYDDVNLTPNGNPTGYRRALQTASLYKQSANFHISGSLAVTLAHANNSNSLKDGPTFINDVKEFVDTDQSYKPGRLITGGVFAEHIIPFFENNSGLGIYVNAKATYYKDRILKSIFDIGYQPRVYWTPERVIRGTSFDDIITDSDGSPTNYIATVIDQVTHLRDWYGITDPYKVYKINGVICFAIDDYSDQKKFWNMDDGLHIGVRELLLNKAMAADQEQLVLVFDDWEAYAGKSFASQETNDNPDNWDKTVRWLATHPWIQLITLEDILDWGWSYIDLGTNLGLGFDTYEYLKHATENSYENWYYGGFYEDDFADAVPVLRGTRYSGPTTIPSAKKYGDVYTSNTIFYETWNNIKNAAPNKLKTLAELGFIATIFETAWHDEDNVDYSRNPDGSWVYPDVTWDQISQWALKLHGKVRMNNIIAEAANWANNVKTGVIDATACASATDVDLDGENEYILYNNRVYAVFENDGGRLEFAFAYNSNDGGYGMVGVGGSNSDYEGEEEGSSNYRRCSAFKDMNNGIYVDDVYSVSVSTKSLTFTSSDGKIIKTFSLADGDKTINASYTETLTGPLYIRFGLSPNQVDMYYNGTDNIAKSGGATSGYVAVTNSAGGTARINFGSTSLNTGFSDGSPDNSNPCMTYQYEIYGDGSFTLSLTLDGGEDAATPPPEPPTNLSATPDSGSILLTWTTSVGPNLSGYFIYKSTDGSTYYKRYSDTIPGSLTQWADTGLTNGNTYWYYLTAVNTSGTEGLASSIVSGTPTANGPPTPTSGLSATPGNQTVLLKWNKNTESDLAGYNVYRGLVSGGPYTKINGSLNSDTDYLDTTVSNGVTYYYVVTAVDTADNQSAYSSETSATPNVLASQDNDVWWSHLKHDPEDSVPINNKNYRSPYQPWQYETPSIYVRSASGDLTGVSLRVWDVFQSKVISPWPTGTFIGSSGEYDYYECQIPALSGQKWYRIAVIDGTDTDWIKSDGAGNYVVSDGGEDNDPAGAIDFTYTPTPTASQDNDVWWDFLGHNPDTIVESETYYYREPINPTQNDTITIYIRAASSDLTGISLRVLDFGDSSVNWYSAQVYDTIGNYQVWVVNIPPDSDTREYRIAVVDGTDTDWLGLSAGWVTQECKQYTAWAVNGTDADADSGAEWSFKPLSSASQDNKIETDYLYFDPDSIAYSGTTYQSPLNPSLYDTIFFTIRTRRDDLSYVVIKLFISDTTTETTPITASKIFSTDIYDFYQAILNPQTDTIYYRIIVVDGSDTKYLKDNATGSFAISSTGNDNDPEGALDFIIRPLLDTTPPAIPQNLGVSNPGSGYSLDINWTPDTDADLSYYKIYRSTLPTATYSFIKSCTTNFYTDTPLLPGITYYYRVSAVDLKGNESEQSDSASNTPNDTLPPACVRLASPQNGASTNDTTPLLVWTTTYDYGSCIKYYRIQLDNDTYFLSIIINDTTTASDTDYQITTGLGEGSYYWRVFAVDLFDNTSSIIDTFNFIIDTTAPGPVTLIKPKYYTNDTPTLFTLSGDVNRYHILISLRFDFLTTVYDTIITGTSVYLSLAENLYYFKSAGVDSTDLEGSFSQPETFILDITKPQITSISINTDTYLYKSSDTIYFNNSSNLYCTLTISFVEDYPDSAVSSSSYGNTPVDSMPDNGFDLLYYISQAETASSTVSIKVYDKSSNSDSKIIFFVRDITPPAFSISPVSDTDNNNDNYQPSYLWEDDTIIIISISASDTISGLAQNYIRASLKPGDTTDWTSSNQLVLASSYADTQILITVYTKDAVSNSSANTITINIDRTLPVISSCTFLDPGYETSYYNPIDSPIVYLYVTYTDTYPDTIILDITGITDPQADSLPVNASTFAINVSASPSADTYNITIYAIDYAGNVGLYTPPALKLDRTSPVVGTLKINNGTLNVADTTFKLTAVSWSDAHSCIKEYYASCTTPNPYLLNPDSDGIWPEFVIPDVSGTHTIYVMCIDNLRNTSSIVSITINYDSKTPVIEQINVTSDKDTYLFSNNPLLSEEDTVWFSNLPSFGANQTITINVTFRANNPDTMTADTAFNKGLQIDTTIADSYTATYTIDQSVTSNTRVIITVYEATGEKDSGIINFARDIDTPGMIKNDTYYGPYNSAPASIIDLDFYDTGVGLEYFGYGVGSPAILQKYYISGNSYTTNWQINWNDISEGTNVIYVTLSDSVGNISSGYDTFIIIKDTTKPDSPLITKPADNSCDSSVNILFTWTSVSEANTYTLIVDNNSTLLSPEYTKITTDTNKTLSLSEGIWYAGVAATDLAGNISDTSSIITFCRDATVPSFVSKYPDNNYVLSDSSVYITISCTDSLSLPDSFYFTLLIDTGAGYTDVGSQMTKYDTGFRYRPAKGYFDSGTIIYVGYIYDRAHNVNVCTVSFRIDTASVPISIISPVDTYIKYVYLDVTIFSEISDTIYLFLDNNLYSYKLLTTQTYTFYAVPLITQGWHTLKACAVNNLGVWSDTITKLVYLDTTPPPAPVLISVTPDTWTGIDSFTIKWIAVNDSSGILYYYYILDNLLLDTSGGIKTTDTQIQIQIGFSQGIHKLYLYSQDKAGNIDTSQYTIVTLYLNSNAPSLYITSPVNNGYIQNLTVTGTITDPEDTPVIVYVLVDGADTTQASVSSQGTWAVTVIITSAGWHTIKAYAVDNSNNTASYEVVAFYDTSTPSIAITPFAVIDTKTSVVVTGSLIDSDIIAITLKQNNDTTYNASVNTQAKTFSATLTLTDGENIFYIDSSDSSGNHSYDTIYIYKVDNALTYDTVKGYSIIPSFTQFDTYSAGVNIQGTTTIEVQIPIYDFTMGQYLDTYIIKCCFADTTTAFLTHRADTTSLLSALNTDDYRLLSFTLYEFKVLNREGADIGNDSSKLLSATLIYKTSRSQIAGKDVTTLKVFYYNPLTATFESVSSSYSSLEGGIVTSLSHLSIFGIFPGATAAQPSLSNLIIYPNPFKPNDGDANTGRWYVAGDFTTGIIFDRLTDDVTIKIFTITGQKVIERRITNTGIAHWDVRNDQGDIVASGVYIAVVEDNKGRGRVIKKIAIIK